LTGRSVQLSDKRYGTFELQVMLHGGGLATLLSAAAAAVAISEDPRRRGRPRAVAGDASKGGHAPA
jgi:hypothetical protein